MKDKNEIKNEKIDQGNDVVVCDCNGCESYDSALFQPFWDEFFWDRPFRRELSSLQNCMRTDIEETEGGYLFKIEAPGLQRKDLNIGFERGYLTVAVNKIGANKTGQNKYLRRERVISACSRSFYVGDIDQNQINASLQDGILTISVPKEVKALRHQIEVK
ncbi:MAG: Hsp20/alpha crystallin family protein [Clostridia bacterium]|nr:Hsp20/alpha crystallin family protein [Clostridia bacterium]